MTDSVNLLRTVVAALMILVLAQAYQYDIKAVGVASHHDEPNTIVTTPLKDVKCVTIVYNHKAESFCFKIFGSVYDSFDGGGEDG